MIRYRYILALCLLVLAGSAVAKDPDPTALVAKVGDRSYNYREFNDGFKAYLQYQNSDKPFTHQDSIRLNNQYWEELVGMYIYDQAIKSGKIKVTQDELERHILVNIPSGVQEIKDFQTNGKFDRKKYEQALRDHPDFKKDVLDYSRDMYAYNKLIKTIKSEVTADPDSVARDWNKAHNTADATIIHFDYTKLTKVTISDDEALQYYEAHKEEYKKSSGRGYLFARFPGSLSKADDKEARAKENKAKSTELYNRALEIGLEKAAGELNIPLEQSGLFAESDDIIPQIGRANDLKTFAFANPLKSIPPIYYALTGDIFVCEVDRETGAFYPEFSYKKDEIMIVATRRKRMYTMDMYVQDFMKKHTPDTYLEAALRDSLSIVEATNITIDSEIKPLGKIPQLNEHILATEPGKFAPLTEKDRHWYLATTTARHTPDPAIWEQEKERLIREATEKVQQDHLNKWYLEQRGKTEITDKRHEYYDILQMIKL